jgi:beta-lactamase class D
MEDIMPITNNKGSFARLGFSLVFLSASIASAQAESIVDREHLDAQIGARQSSFLAVDIASGETCILQGSDLETRHAPWSTFKIPNTVIALATGVLDGVDTWRNWDAASRPPEGYWPEAWRQGQTLESAFQRSAVWFYQDIALDVGAPAYRATLTAWNYGNGQVPENSDTFWLGGPLALSVTEQVRFIEQLMIGNLDVPQIHLDTLAEISILEQTGRFSLHGKSGSGPVSRGDFSGPFEGWFAGWLSTDGVPSVAFAHHTVGPDFASIREYRQDFAQHLLSECGYTFNQVQ